MSIKVTRKDILWSYAGYGLMYGMNILLLPLILRLLDVKEMGLWYTFLSINQIVMFLDFGFMPAVLRNASFCWAGAQVLVKEGFAPCDQKGLGSPNLELLGQVVGASRKLYSIIGGIAGLVLILGGFPFLKVIARDLPPFGVNLAWLIFACGVFVNIRYAYWNPLLRGVGAIAESNKATVLARGFQLLAASLGLIAGGGLVAVAAAFLCGGIASRTLMRRYFNSKLGAQVDIVFGSLRQSPESCKHTMGVLWYGAKRQGLAVLASSLIQQSDVLICATLLGLKATAAYGITLQLFTMVASGSAVLFNAYVPRLNEAGLRGDLNRTRTDFSRTLVVSWVLIGAGTLVITTSGPLALKWFASDKHMLSPLLCLLMGLIVAIETNYGLFYAFLTTRNRIPPPAGYLITGLAQPLMSVLLISGLKMGFFGILLSRLAAQLAYLSWRWPQLGLKELNSSLPALLKHPFRRRREDQPRQCVKGVSLDG